MRHFTIISTLLTVIAVLLALNLLVMGTSVTAAPNAGVNGACCDVQVGGVCMTRTEAECADIGGIYYGDGTVECPPESPCSIYGACCQPITGTCSIDNEPGCFNGGVNSGIWKGEGTDCLDNDFNGSPDICEATCPADLDTDGDVGIVDFLILLSQWGPCE